MDFHSFIDKKESVIYMRGGGGHIESNYCVLISIYNDKKTVSHTWFSIARTIASNTTVASTQRSVLMDCLLIG